MGGFSVGMRTGQAHWPIAHTPMGTISAIWSSRQPERRTVKLNRFSPMGLSDQRGRQLAAACGGLLLTAGSQLLWRTPSYSGQIQIQRKKERGDFLQIQDENKAAAILLLFLWHEFGVADQQHGHRASALAVSASGGMRQGLVGLVARVSGTCGSIARAGR